MIILTLCHKKNPHSNYLKIRNTDINKFFSHYAKEIVGKTYTNSSVYKKPQLQQITMYLFTVHKNYSSSSLLYMCLVLKTLCIN